jgi:uncharacterized protein
MQTTTNFRERYGPWAVVAGASEGLGAAYASQLAALGLNLVLVARRADLLKTLAVRLFAEYDVQVKTVLLDLADQGSAEQLERELAGMEVGLFVYNAAYSAVGPFAARCLEDHLREIDTNIRTPLAMVYRFGQGMLERGRGGVILMSSMSAFQGSAYISNYAASKAYNMLLGEGLWEEWRERGVDVLVCAAGSTRTPNYLASEPKQTGGFADSSMEPEQVAREALGALGQQPMIIPGRSNRMASFFMRHLLPRKMGIRMMGSILRKMYVEDESERVKP